MRAYVLPIRSSEEKLGGLIANIDNWGGSPQQQPQRLKDVEFLFQ